MSDSFTRELERLGIISKRKYPEDRNKYNDPLSMNYKPKMLGDPVEDTWPMGINFGE